MGAMRGIYLIWAAIVTMEVVGAGGCFVAGVPAIQPGTGDDVGEVFEYRNYSAPGQIDLQMRTHFARKDGNQYRIEFLVLNQTPSQEDQNGTANIWRVGSRGADPVYAIQVGPESDDPTAPAGNREFVLGLLALRQDNVGVFALFDCTNPGILSLAAERGMTFSCEGESHFVSRLSGQASSAEISGFLEASMAQNLVRWEDWAGISLYDEIANQF